MIGRSTASVRLYERGSRVPIEVMATMLSVANQDGLAELAAEIEVAAAERLAGHVVDRPQTEDEREFAAYCHKLVDDILRADPSSLAGLMDVLDAYVFRARSTYQMDLRAQARKDGARSEPGDDRREPDKRSSDEMEGSTHAGRRPRKSRRAAPDREDRET